MNTTASQGGLAQDVFLWGYVLSSEGLNTDETECYGFGFVNESYSTKSKREKHQTFRNSKKQVQPRSHMNERSKGKP